MTNDSPKTTTNPLKNGLLQNRDIAASIFGFLRFRDLLRLRGVSKLVQRWANSDGAWENKLTGNFPYMLQKVKLMRAFALPTLWNNFFNSAS